MGMQPLFSVHNNVSLISITIAPSAWVASIVILLFFAALYLPPLLPSIPGACWRFLSSISLFGRNKKQEAKTLQPIIEVIEEVDEEDAHLRFYQERQRLLLEDKPLPAITDHLYYLTAEEHIRRYNKERSGWRSSGSRSPEQRRYTSYRKSSGSKDREGRIKVIEYVGSDSDNANHRSPPRPTTTPRRLSHPQDQYQLQMPFGYPSAHSGFRSDDVMSETESLESVDTDLERSSGRYSPPAWRRLGNGDRSSGFWRKTETDRQLLYEIMNQRPTSRDGSPGFESADEFGDEILEEAIRTRLPGSMSPEKERSPAPERYYNAQQHLQSINEAIAIKQEDDQIRMSDIKEFEQQKEIADNYIRFAVRAEVQHRTEPIDATIRFVHRVVGTATQSWLTKLLSVVVLILSFAAMRFLTRPAGLQPVPDLVKVAGVARSLEPLIYYSENGAQQVGELQATGLAVWDLGESVRSSNMTSAPIIVQELDELSDSLKTLAIELTKFFANVDGDIDGILLTMDWARRELTQLNSLPTHTLSSLFDNTHSLMSAVGLLEDSNSGSPTRLGHIFTSLFGPSTPQRTKHTLQRTFYELLAVLEEAVASELAHSLSLFALFEAIDRQFLNLHRTVSRESTLQDERHDNLLSSLWTRILGAKASEMAKYERNRLLLQNVREKTVRNKGVLVEHNARLLALKSSLENLRKKLVSPIVRNAVNGSSYLTLEEQIRGLEEVGGYLEDVRRKQKGKVLEALYGVGDRGRGRGYVVGIDGMDDDEDEEEAMGYGGYGYGGGAGYGGGERYEGVREGKVVS
ncbi:hypothetical protein QBC43DRAFT_288803 [Cladorrhinum sp. PSN259]|nr:hypothetical protein QBC43DRAFT_288803 [Cladorrhinum sp. PSN259]